MQSCQYHGRPGGEEHANPYLLFLIDKKKLIKVFRNIFHLQIMDAKKNESNSASSSGAKKDASSKSEANDGTQQAGGANVKFDDIDFGGFGAEGGNKKNKNKNKGGGK
jgi:hypothetical protein